TVLGRSLGTCAAKNGSASASQLVLYSSCACFTTLQCAATMSAFTFAGGVPSAHAPTTSSALASSMNSWGAGSAEAVEAARRTNSAERIPRNLSASLGFQLQHVCFLELDRRGRPER